MHELFLTAHIRDEDVSRALRILQGYCEMGPVSFFTRRLIWEAPRAVKSKGFDAAWIKRQQQPKQQLWRSLNEQLVRQPYVVTLLYGANREQFGGAEASEETSKENKATLDEEPGTIYWTDLPDPGSARPVNSRNAVTIENEKGLCSLLRSMGYRFSKEVIQEVHRFINGNVIITLCRYLNIPTNLQEKDDKSQPKINTFLPAYDKLEPFDSENKWIITVRVDVLNSNDQDQMKKGTDELVVIQEAFEGCFDFKLMDRHTFDTRVR